MTLKNVKGRERDCRERLRTSDEKKVKKTAFTLKMKMPQDSLVHNLL